MNRLFLSITILCSFAMVFSQTPETKTEQLGDSTQIESATDMLQVTAGVGVPGPDGKIGKWRVRDTIIETQESANSQSLIVSFVRSETLRVVIEGDLVSTGFSAVDLILSRYKCTGFSKRYVNGPRSISDFSYYLHFASPIDVISAREELLATGAFKYIELNRMILLKGGAPNSQPNDTKYPIQWGLTMTQCR